MDGKITFNLKELH